MFVPILLALTLLLSLANNAVVAENSQCGVPSAQGSIRPYKILMTCSQSFVPVLMNWLVFYYQICPSRKEEENLFIICLDSETETALRKVGLKCGHRHGVVKRQKVHYGLWIARTYITNSLLNEGYDVLMCDNDAMWLRNPWPVIVSQLSYTNATGAGADIVSSRGDFPQEVSSHLGACLCFGFMYLKSTPITKALWTFYKDGMRRINFADDQRALNRALMHYFLRYRKRPRIVGYDDTDYGIVELPSNVATYRGPHATPRSTGNRRENYLRIALLGHESFRRVCQGQSLSRIKESIVLHCLTTKTDRSKHDVLKELGLWVVKEGEAWAQAQAQEDTTVSGQGGLLSLVDLTKAQAIFSPSFALHSQPGNGSANAWGRAGTPLISWHPGTGLFHGPSSVSQEGGGTGVAVARAKRESRGRSGVGVAKLQRGGKSRRIRGGGDE